MAKTVGTYYFARRRNHFSIYIVESISSNGIEMGSFVKDVFTYEDAVKETYSLNGWGTPKNIVRKY